MCQPPIARYIGQLSPRFIATRNPRHLTLVVALSLSLKACAGPCAAGLPRPHARGTARHGPEGTRRACARRPPRWGCGAPPPTSACLHHTASTLDQASEHETSVLVGTRTVRGELDRVGFPALSRPVPIRPVQRPAVMERPEIVILFGLARRTARKSRKYHYFTHRRAAARRTPPRSRSHAHAARSRSPTRPRSGCHASPCRRGRRASGESRRRT